MPKSHLPAHMDSVRQKCRPKHQLLVLKCYPRLPKNSAAEAKPNGSELSYLLYYASTRPSKLPKVGGFLERKTASDVSHSQSARILVTLLILSALLENKAVGDGNGFALIAPYILRIIREILQRTNDISLIEASTQTWHIFCRHQDPGLLAADHEYRTLYEQVVRHFAALAHNNGNKKLGSSNQSMAVQDQIRLRHSGLEAIKSILAAENLITDVARPLRILTPAILSNLNATDDAYLVRLSKKLTKRNEDEEKKEKALTRRQSVSIARNLIEPLEEADPRQAEGTASDADELARQETAVLALACLQAVFTTENRNQIRLGTDALLKELAIYENSLNAAVAEKSVMDLSVNTWAKKLLELCTSWTPVQDRFIIMLTAVETLIRLPISESDLQLHLLYVDLIDHILRSNLNLIGLSVMDILLGLIQQTLRILHLSNPLEPSPLHDQRAVPLPASTPQSVPPEAHLASAARIRLTGRMRDCVAVLATHIYYTDQVTDMLAAILLRLKPDPAPVGAQNPLLTAAAIEEPRMAVNEVASNVSLNARARSNSGSKFFSFETARCIALEMVRDILKVANSSQSISSTGVAESRNKVPVSVWEGTQWLLRDPHPPVRRLYVDALATWFSLEIRPAQFRIEVPQQKPKRANEAIARRAISNASSRNRGPSKKATSTFLQLLHLAVYENAIDFAEASEADITLLHCLLYSLVRKLGVNAVRGGLPMIFALQDDVANVKSPNAKIRIASLVHGYLWTLVDVFGLDVTAPGQAILNEINHRKQYGLWVESLRVPAATAEQVADIANTTKYSSESLDEGHLHFFDDRNAVVERISEAYVQSVMSPPNSPPGSPMRLPSRPIASPSMDRKASSYLGVQPISEKPRALPEDYKDAMLEHWSKQTCLAAIAAAAPRSISLSGSQSTPPQALLPGAGALNVSTMPNSGAVRNPSITPSHSRGPAPHRQQAFGKRPHSQSPGRTGSAGGSTHGANSSSVGTKDILRVDELKRLLANGGGAGFITNIVNSSTMFHDDTGSESMVEVDDSDFVSENEPISALQQQLDHTFNLSPTVPETVPEDTTIAARRGRSTSDVLRKLDLSAHNSSSDQRPATSGTTDRNHTFSSAPPVPPLPALAGKPPPSRDGRASVKSKSATLTKRNLKSLLAGIDTGDDGSVTGEQSLGNLVKPPY